MPNLARATLTLALTLALITAPVTHAQALPTPKDAINVIEGILDEFCELAGFSVFGIGAGDIAGAFGLSEALDSLLFLCDYQGVLRRSTRAATALFEDVDETARQVAAGAYEQVFTRFVRTPFPSAGAGPTPRSIETELRDLLEEVRIGIAEGDDTAPTMEDYRRFAQQALIEEADNALRYFESLAANPRQFPDGSPMRAFAEALRANPAVGGLTRSIIEESLDLALERVDTETAFQAGAMSAEAFIDTADYQQATVRTLDPVDGTAVTLARRATAATSTRESINELARGWADYMRQDAVFSSTIIDGLKQLVRQQTVTNEALRVEAVGRIAERERALEQQQAVLESELMGTHVDVMNFMVSLEATVNAVDDILDVASEYPPDFCARFHCPTPRAAQATP